VSFFLFIFALSKSSKKFKPMENQFISHDMASQLKQYLENTPKEEVVEGWEETKEFDEVGVPMDEFLKSKNEINMEFSEKFASKDYGKQLEIHGEADNSFQELMRILADVGSEAKEDLLLDFDTQNKKSVISALEKYGESIKIINERFEKFKTLVNLIYDL
jgi:hypothetical protein